MEHAEPNDGEVSPERAPHVVVYRHLWLEYIGTEASGPKPVPGRTEGRRLRSCLPYRAISQSRFTKSIKKSQY
jgi:hypothetical protein